MLIKLILLMMSTEVLETCTELEYICKKNCASSWLFTRTEPSCTVNKTKFLVLLIL
jgi:hypothetical protein